VYIGITTNPESRFKQHFEKRSNCTKLKRAIEKYGSDKFSMEILCIGEESYIIDLEVKAIIAYGSIENGYNLTLGNPRTGALSLAPETRQRISDSLNKYYSENIAWNSGIIIGRRKEYDPHYVCGFWFPHLEDACSALNLKVTQLHKWRREGTLGDTHRPRKDSLEKPLYVAGFWFDTITRASLKLSLDRKTVFKRVRDGNVEERQRPKGQKPEDCHMNGKTGFLHHNSKAIEIHGVVYGSIAEASRESGFTKKVIYNRLKNNTPGFSWYIEKQEEI
jgi:hypothetical protein